MPAPPHSSAAAAVCVVVLVTAVNNYQKERQFRALQAITEDTQVLPACSCCWAAAGAAAATAAASGLLGLQLAPPEQAILLPPANCISSHARLRACLPACLQVRAIRHGREQALPVRKVAVGDLLLVETGDILCTDGLLVAGSDVK